MNKIELIDRTTAKTYATWFRALSDPTRIQVLNLLAVTDRPMTVGEITAALPIGQSTVSHHLKILAETRFVLVEPAGTANLYHVNQRRLTCFPSAADAVMGHQAPQIDDNDCES
ncbi:transcriptional regulator, ArsR family [Catenulispora acidiphila DSM 44928]|uniref:Transcriptional regulator, ArsR family n=1 Tax=Catenulispora acidiphila (strain DSM 44928 / JCM 14897 / NBRC 102108 / NRRL B-24433 / ID139908) TaxID=479433 RepID=C7Q0A1_CATAD|nr:metalloregulator ArsR/SmtB family transcription factor [Catenulispora acidiphila]ACU77434.1 transcriptional regulator, ArsR family [Catenulispora acidiphila DSM 44928]